MGKGRVYLIFFFFSDGRLFSVFEGSRSQQALPGARGRRAVLHRTTKIPHPGSAGGPLPEGADIHQQAGREAVSGSSTSKNQITDEPSDRTV